MGKSEVDQLQRTDANASRTFTETQELPKGSHLYIEGVARPDLDAASVSGTFGMKYFKEDLARFGLALDPGFDYLVRTPPGMPEEDAVEDEFSAVGATVKATLEAVGWKPEEVEGVFAGSGSPPEGRDFMGDILKRCGLTNATMKHLAHLACNTGGELVWQAMRKANGKKALVIVDEGMTRKSTRLDDMNADNLSKTVFANGVVALAFVPGESFSLVPDMVERGASEDTRGALAAVMTYDHPAGELFHEDEEAGVTTIRLPKPPAGKVINMDGFATAKEFLKAIPGRIRKVVEPYKERYHTTKNIQFAVPHHAGFEMGLGIVGILKRLGIDIEFPWVVRDGNSSASTTLKAFTKLLGRMEKGKDILLVSFGAGISWTIFVFRVGEFTEEAGR